MIRAERNKYNVIGQNGVVSVDQISHALALLACVSAAVAIVIATSWLVARFGMATQWWDTLRVTLAQVALPLATAIALVTVSGSLYYSEVANFPPCRLCWFQRIFAYPLAPMLVLAILRQRDRAVRPYALVLCAIGGCISVYHMVIEAYPSLETGSCDLDNPCSTKWVDVFGVFTIPTMALCSFVGIGVLLLAWPSDTRARSQSADVD